MLEKINKHPLKISLFILLLFLLNLSSCTSSSVDVDEIVSKEQLRLHKRAMEIERRNKKGSFKNKDRVSVDKEELIKLIY
ncbi:MAG: hypothetical protein GY909_15430 [Oligoflexia bacterium]|nr:hypothetical protein [Oligoflexia bacterium]